MPISWVHFNYSSRSSQSRSARFDSKKSIASIRHSVVAKTTSTSVSLNGPPDGPPRIIRRKNNSTNVILLCIVLLFLVCHILRFFGLYYYDDLTEFADGCMQIYRNGTKECHETNGTSTNIYETPEVNYPKWLWSLNPVGSLLLLMNSSLNFVIYVLAGTRFRKTFLRKIKTLSSCLRRSAFTAETEIPINDSGLVTQGKIKTNLWFQMKSNANILPFVAYPLYNDSEYTPQVIYRKPIITDRRLFPRSA